MIDPEQHAAAMVRYYGKSIAASQEFLAHPPRRLSPQERAGRLEMIAHAEEMRAHWQTKMEDAR